MMKHKSLFTLIAIFILSRSARADMPGMLGPYSMSREASGTSWQPESTPHQGLHLMAGDWMHMFHGMGTLLYDDQGGRRGDEKFISTNMAMWMVQGPVSVGTFGFRTMLTLEPVTVGKSGYPLLLQSGETADGEHHLIDRQHPHDLFMELAGSYSVPMNETDSVFLYLGYPGEPALGPPTFMHRFSGMENPEAPISHHWMDSTHVTFGVLTVGTVWGKVKLEASQFTGREPNEDRWDFDDATFDSSSGRVSYNPTKDWAFQVSMGHLNGPEQLEPDIDQDRMTSSLSYNHPWDNNNIQTTFAWGRNNNKPGHILDAFLLESTLVMEQTHTFFGRLERAEKDELFEEDAPEAGKIFTVGKLSVGYIYDFASFKYGQIGVGGLESFYFLPSSLDEAYGHNPMSFMIFVRAKLGSGD